MNQRVDPDQIEDTQSPLLKDISLDKPGVWAKRKGFNLLASAQAGSGVQGLIEYTPADGNAITHAIRSQALESYSPDSYVTIAAGQFASASEVASVNFLGRVYHVSPSDYLQYEDGSTCTVVGTADDRIQARCLAVSQQSLFVGGVTGHEDRVYFSMFDLENNTPTHQTWAVNETSLAESTRWFTLFRPVTALYSYGTTRKVYAFTEYEMYEFDLLQAENGTAVQKVADVGCCGPRAITQCNGWLIWMDATGRLRIWGGSGPVMPLSWALEDDSGGDALINNIDKTDLSVVAAGSIGSKFWFSVGDVTVFNETIENCNIVGVITQDLSTVLWSLYSYPERFGIFANSTFNGSKVLLAGSSESDNIYQLETGTNDEATAIDAFAITKFLAYGAPFKTRSGDYLIIKYRPQSTEGTYLYVQYAIDGSTTYQDISNPDAGSPVTTHGVVDMYSSDYATRRDAVCRVELPANVRFRTLSLKLGNAQTGESFAISGLQLVRSEERDLDINSKTI